MTSFPVSKQSLITRKQLEIEEKLQLTANSKSRSACPCYIWGATPSSGEIGVTSFSVFKQSLLNGTRCELQ